MLDSIVDAIELCSGDHQLKSLMIRLVKEMSNDLTDLSWEPLPATQSLLDDLEELVSKFKDEEQKIARVMIAEDEDDDE